MTASVRFKNVQNTTGAALTTAGVASGDGDDRSYRLITRPLVAADIGTGAGQTQHALGCIIDVLPGGLPIGSTSQPGVNILDLSGASWKAVAAAGGRPACFKRLDNMITRGAANIVGEIAEIEYFFYPTDNTIRVYDAGGVAGNATAALAAGDYVEVLLTFGPNQS